MSTFRNSGASVSTSEETGDIVYTTGSRDPIVSTSRQPGTSSSEQVDPESQVISAAHEDVFGNEEGADIHYKTCSWWQTSILILAENVSLGVLALPQALAILGILPGILCIVFLGLIATYTGWIIGEFKLAHPGMQSFADCGMLIAGPIGREVMAVASVLILIFIMGAHILSFAIAMNVLTDHATCTIIFSVIGLALSFALGLPRTFKGVSYISIFSCLSIISAVTVAMIAIGIEKPDMGNVLAVRPELPLIKGIGPVMNIILAYTGHVAFLSFQAELKDPREFKKALFVEQGIAISFYTTISIVIYYFAGPLVSSPALGSASATGRKIAFGFALPTIVVAGVVNGSVACKYIYVRIWRGTDVVHKSNWRSLSSWCAICAVLWLVSWVLAEAIPNFNLLLGLIAALFGSWFSYALPPVMWFYQYKGKLFTDKRMIAMSCFNTAVFMLGLSIFVLGMWSSGIELHNGSGGKVFSCDNNWSPVSAILKNNA